MFRRFKRFFNRYSEEKNGKRRKKKQYIKNSYSININRQLLEDDEKETPLYRIDIIFLEESEFNPPIKKSKRK